MPHIFDNLTEDSRLLPALQNTLKTALRADFCVGYINLRGWSGLAPFVERWDKNSDGVPCRVLIGMQKLPHDELQDALGFKETPSNMDNQTANRTRLKLAKQLRQQLTIGSPNNEDEIALRQLAEQLRSGKVTVKLFLRHTLHAKLYLAYRNDQDNPITGYLGSSNLTFSGLSGQGELNVKVVDWDPADKLRNWFEERWSDRFCVDITNELVQIIEESWARTDLISPYHIYLKMAYHISHEAREGLADYKIPKIFGNKLFDFQAAAVKIAAHHLYKRGGVLIGDVVGLGKTLMATALARIFEEDYGMQTLIICPKNLQCMWEDYVHRYGLRAKIVPISMTISKLPDLRRYQLVIIDESHNLRNREGRRYRAIQDYVRANESKCILLSATPYNKTYHDLSGQLRIFIGDEQDLGIRPERMLREMGEIEFNRQHQSSPRTITAFEFSTYADDWRDLMSLYMVRRTREFIQKNYANTDQETNQKFLMYEDGTKSFFPIRVPRTIKFVVDDSNETDQYSRLYSQQIVNVINSLKLPRYGLGRYISDDITHTLTGEEETQIHGLSKAGRHLTGFCRTNMFKRLESSGTAFLMSIQRHVLRNHVFLYAIRNKKPLPIGTQDAEILDTQFDDGDSIIANTDEEFIESEKLDEYNNKTTSAVGNNQPDKTLEYYATKTYKNYEKNYQNRFKWIRSDVFVENLENDLQADIDALQEILRKYGTWDPKYDTKLNALYTLLADTYPDYKVLVFTQFADTVHYLEEQLISRGLKKVSGVTGNSKNPTKLAHRFSPDSNQADVTENDELRILVATDVLSEGQNLQDCHIVVNYDLPWAIIRLIQRAGRVDRIGQKAKEIFCMSFLPADGIERIIDLRGRVLNRLEQNAEVLGSEELFFEDKKAKQTILDLYHEHAGILDGYNDGEVDLASQAYQIWKNAISADPKIEKIVTGLPDVTFTSRLHKSNLQHPNGVLVFARTADDNNALAYVDHNGKSITESQMEILKMAQCDPDTPAQTRHAMHHKLVESGVIHIAKEEKRTGGQLGRPSGARFRAYTRLKTYADIIRDKDHLTYDSLRKTLDDIYRHPLTKSATDTLNRQLRIGISDYELAQMASRMRDEDRLCITDKQNEATRKEPRIVCSMGLFDTSEVLAPNDRPLQR